MLMLWLTVLFLSSPILSAVVEDCNSLESRFSVAITKDDVDTVRDILYHARIFDPNYDNGRALIRACMQGRFEIVKVLLSDSRVKVNPQNNQPVMIAALNDRWDIVEFLLSISDVDPSVQQSFVLRHACIHGKYEIVKLLLKDDRVDPSSEQCAALTNACENGHLRIVHRLLKHPKVDPTILEANPLHFALLNGHTEVINALILDRRLLKLFEDNIPKYTTMIIQAVEALLQDKYIIAINLLLTSLFRGLLPIRYLVDLYRDLPFKNLIAKRLLMEPGALASVFPAESYSEFITGCLHDQRLYHLVLLSGLTPLEQQDQLISRCIADGHVDVLEQLVYEGADLSKCAWKLAGTHTTKNLRMLLNTQIKERLAKVRIGDKGTLMVILAMHFVHGIFGDIVRYIPFLNYSKPFTLLQLIHHHIIQ